MSFVFQQVARPDATLTDLGDDSLVPIYGLMTSMAKSKVSAGLLMYRYAKEALQVLLVHPGGPFFANKDLQSWSIPKGEPAEGEDLLAAAQREFLEETGQHSCPPFLPLSTVRQAGGKIVHAWAFQGDCDPSIASSNTFTLEWPPHSGRFADFPEVDRAEFFPIALAREKINRAQQPLLDELASKLDLRR
jgi:predicted NUDIX family NTP pyrophosphohydrolase